MRFVKYDSGEGPRAINLEHVKFADFEPSGDAGEGGDKRPRLLVSMSEGCDIEIRGDEAERIWHILTGEPGAAGR